MSFLAPFYVLGALAIAAPIVFHLIRRAPRGEVPFSSLMFLTPTPPRLTKRNRLDNWLLLLLRAAALGLLAFAFARPFLRQAALLDPGEAPRQRVAVLVDASASMRRGDLWPRAVAAAKGAIDECRPGDELAVYAFDATIRPLIGFEESATLDPVSRQAAAKSRLDEAAPSWGGTDLGRALIDAASAVQDAPDASEEAGRMPRRVVLVGDLQRGSRLDLLGGFEWPADVGLEVRAVSDESPNAGVQWLAAEAAGAEVAGGESPLRVRVSSDPGSARERFSLRWSDAAGKHAGEPVEVYVPPGESRVARVPRPPPSASVLHLEGDLHDFDNAIYLAEDRREGATVVAIAEGAEDDPAGLLYYLGRVYRDLPGREIRLRVSPPGDPFVLDPKELVPLVVLAAETSAENLGRLKEYASGGGTVLVVLASAAQGKALAELIGAPAGEAREAEAGRDVMLGEIAFDHPLFAPFAGAQFNDFTKIRFWKYRRLDASVLGDARVLARFEGGDPAVAEKPIGRGRIVALASSWAPADSQLSRSSKFVPLMMGLLEGPGAVRLGAAGFRVGDPVPLPAPADPAKKVTVRKPDGSVVAMESGATAFAGADMPGVYTADLGGPAPVSFAVNLDPAEGATAPLPVEALEQLGVRLAGGPPEAVDPEQIRQMRNVELEGRQQAWRWLILAAIGILIVETLLAGRVARPRAIPAEATSS